MAFLRVTSAEVAKLAGVSQSAVSRVFTPGASASQKTIDKVQKAAAELGYRPNSLARAMVSGHSGIIGLVVAYLDNHFYPEAVEKISLSLQQSGYHVLIFFASQTAGTIDDVVAEILDYQVDGIITASIGLSSNLTNRCRAAGVPIVQFNRSQQSNESADVYSYVTSDNYNGGRKIASFLVAGGHQRIGYIAGWDGASTQQDREAGFIDALTESGTSLYARESGNFVFEQAADAARRMFGTNKPRAEIPEAVFVANDHMAFAVMDVLRYELGYRIPNDVSVVGYDDVPTAAWASYNLTTVRQAANRMVAATIETLLNEIEGDDKRARQVTIDGPLIVRGSARIPQGWHS